MPTNPQSFRDYHICRACGARHDQHGTERNPHRPFACPPPKPFPKFPASVERKRGMEAAQVVFAARLATYWTARSTVFTG